LKPFWQAMTRGQVADWVREIPFDPEEVAGVSQDSWFTLKRCAWDEPAPTLTARGLMPISLSGPLYPSSHRKFSIPEIMRLFGVPDDFNWGPSTASEAAQRLGLMVPPPMAEALFRALSERVLRPHRESMRARTGMNAA
jgi:site-specific DNA-cytosine methylase